MSAELRPIELYDEINRLCKAATALKDCLERNEPSLPVIVGRVDEQLSACALWNSDCFDFVLDRELMLDVVSGLHQIEIGVEQLVTRLFEGTCDEQARSHFAQFFGSAASDLSRMNDIFVDANHYVHKAVHRRRLESLGAVTSLDTAVLAGPPAIVGNDQPSVRRKYSATKPRLELHPVGASPHIVFNGTPYPLTPDQCQLLQLLVSAEGEWVSASENRLRADRLKKKLPKPLRELIEAEPGKGQRISRQNLAELGLI